MAAFCSELFPAGERVLCALSGGADSMYLLCRLLETGVPVTCAHYNHQLRETAGRDEQFVRSWCESRGIPLVVGRGDVAGEAKRLGQGIEETARQLRYAFLGEAARQEGCQLIATGHHAGDNAETVLMNLIRGSGARGLCGIPQRRGNVVRPMLSVTRREIEAYLTAHAVPHVEDESNGEVSYTRNRVRLQLLPLLEELNPRAAEHICAAAIRLREDDEELTRQGRELAGLAEKSTDEVSISVSVLTAAPRPIAVRCLQELLEGADARQLEQVLALCGSSDPSGELNLRGCTVRRVYDRLLISEVSGESSPGSVPLAMGEIRWGSWRITCEEAVCPAKAYVSREEFYLKSGDYLIRSRREGDSIRLGNRPIKTVKKLMIDEKIPRHVRSFVPVLDCEGVAALGGFGPHRGALAAPGECCLHITVRKGE